MPDYYFLTSPQGSVYNLGSWIRADPGPDFGSGVLNAAYAENPANEGGNLAFESIGVRKMSFPLLLASHSAWTGLLPLESMLRLAARPGGAVLDLLPDGTPTAEAVRFDVLTGRLQMAYDLRMHGQLRKHYATLELDTQPFGYWPTMILLASAASIGGPGILSIPNASIVGDVPGLAELFVAPTSATSYGVVQKTDSIYWSLGARASFQAFWPAGSAVGIGSHSLYTPTLTADVFAPASQSFRYWLASANNNAGLQADGWQGMAAWVIPPSLEPAFRGRFRAFAWAKLSPSQFSPFYASLDVQGGSLIGQALASAAPVATLPVSVASAGLGGGQGASPAYSFLDLGEVGLPISGSNPYEVQFRLWFTSATLNLGIAATGQLDIGGLYLQPLDGAAAILPRSILQPTWTAPSVLGRLYANAITGDTLIASPTSVVGSIGALGNIAQHNRGILPRVGASTIQLDINLAGKQAQLGAPTGAPPLRSEPHFAQVSVRYRPRFAFIKGL